MRKFIKSAVSLREPECDCIFLTIPRLCSTRETTMKLRVRVQGSGFMALCF